MLYSKPHENMPFTHKVKRTYCTLSGGSVLKLQYLCSYLYTTQTADGAARRGAQKAPESWSLRSYTTQMGPKRYLDSINNPQETIFKCGLYYISASIHCLFVTRIFNLTFKCYYHTVIRISCFFSTFKIYYKRSDQSQII